MSGEIPAAGERAAGGAKATPCILLVDDEQAIRRVAKRALELGGFRVLLAENGREAVSVFAAQRHAIGLVVLDLIMPEMSGVGTFLALKQLEPKVKVLLCSGYDQHDAIEQLKKEGLCGVIQKPYRVNTLITKVRGSLTLSTS